MNYHSLTTFDWLVLTIASLEEPGTVKLANQDV